MKYLEQLYEVYKIRKVEEKLLELYTQGYIGGTVHTCVGQEYTGVFISKYLDKEDVIFSNHRGHGHFISKTKNIKGLIAEILSKKEGVSSGYGGSQHLYSHDFISNGIQGSLLSIAAGMSFSFKKYKNENICVIFIGDGTLGQGSVYEALNIISLYNCPILIVLEDNEIAQSTPSINTFLGKISEIVTGFGIKYTNTSIWELEHLDTSCKNAIEYVKSSSMPAFIHIKCSRINSHSKGDDNRSSNYIENLKERDVLQVNIRNGVLDVNELTKIENDIENIVSQIIPMQTLDKAARAINLIENFNNRQELLLVKAKNDNKKLVTRINETFNNLFNDNKELIHIGEDIEDLPKGTEKIYGGAFKVTKGISTNFPGRVFNTPIAESAIIGFSTGYCLTNKPVIAEIMFGDFMTLTVDQLIQNASKFKTMYGKALSLPLIVRTPMGGRRGYGPTHSQSIEKLFFGVHGLNVIALNKYTNVDNIYNYSFNKQISATPTILIENKLLYNESSEFKLPGYSQFECKSINGTINRISIPVSGKANTLIFSYGFSSKIAEEVAGELYLEYEEKCILFSPESISPLSLEGLTDETLKNCNRILCIEEGGAYGSASEHFIACLNQKGYTFTDVRIFSNDSTIPSSPLAENDLMPNKENILTNLTKNK
jgi:2-oxoisovalerate dehydrogenase E1 component